jgi:hypothetical protein
MGELMPKPGISFEARDAFRRGDGIDDNPYPKGTDERLDWAWAMHQCQYEEFKQLMAGFS